MHKGRFKKPNRLTKPEYPQVADISHLLTGWAKSTVRAYFRSCSYGSTAILQYAPITV
jgi:hypothetical protein